jgi:hypothetical protein
VETIVAHRVDATRLRVLRAERRATSKRALSSADWTVDTVDAPIIRVDTFSVATTAPGLPAPAAAAAGWYDDDKDTPKSRWWNGAHWTNPPSVATLPEPE